MELLEGKSLLILFVEQAPLPWHRVFEIVSKIGSALGPTHAAGIALGTLRPENIYLVERGGEEVVELVELKIDQVTARDPAAPRTTRIEPGFGERLELARRHRGFVGDVSYLAPEQLMGKPVDVRCDVYTLGVIAYELISGRRPFGDDKGPAALITAMLKTKPQPLAAPGLAATELLMSCLDPDKQRRPADATALARAIGDVLAGERRTLRGIVAPAPVEGLEAFNEPPATSRGAIIHQIIETRSCGSQGCPALHAVLPGPNHETIGSWMFLDHSGPTAMGPGQGMDIDAHPHIGLVSVRYQLEGQMIHRDNLGNELTIAPGGVSWVRAGSGIVHSERTSPLDRRRDGRMHALQLWLAMPSAHEDDAPHAVYYGPDALPSIVIGGVRVRVIAGEAFGIRSPVVAPALTSLIDIRIPGGAVVPIEAPRNRATARAIYVVSGAVEVGDTIVTSHRLAILAPHGTVRVATQPGSAAHIVVLGSAPLVEPCFYWWTFVATSHERIETAKRRWADDAFGSIPGESGRLPLPAD